MQKLLKVKHGINTARFHGLHRRKVVTYVVILIVMEITLTVYNTIATQQEEIVDGALEITASKKSRTKPWKSQPLATALPTKATTPTIARTRQPFEANWTCRATTFLLARKGTWSGQDLLRYHQEHQT